jgi:metal-sulfur cluster biosynthetic enzyme
MTKNQMLDVLRYVDDPELGMNIVDLGLVYRVEAADDHLEVEFTLTTPGCPEGEYIEARIVEKLEEASGLPVEAKLVWSPMWGPEYMSDEAKIALGYPI